MAYESGDVIRSVRAILQESRESREFDVATALQMMQIASAQKAQKMEMAESQLKRLEITNLQMSHLQANDFLTLTGFNRWYNPEDEGWASTMVDDLIDSPDMEDGVNTGGFGFNEHDAWRIAGAVQSFYLKEPGAILEIASELSSKADTGVQDSFVKGFYNTGIFSETKREITYQQLANIDKTILNRDMIAQESYEFGMGDFDISRDISMAERVTMPTGDEKDDLTLAVNAATQGAFSSEIQGLINSIDTDKSTELQLKNKLKNLSVEISAAKAKNRVGLDLTPTQESLLQDEFEAIGLVEDEIRDLNISIQEKRGKAEELTRLNREEAIRTGEVEMWPSITHFGIDPLQKIGLWNKTGIWPDDELLAAAEDIASKKRTIIK
jgi:hypothetical protein|tara:strand:- start:10 stop:1155 length:1146 start_codon:yes stop_codon:yes gene_type:complete